MYWIRRIATSSLSLCLWLFVVEVTFYCCFTQPPSRHVHLVKVTKDMKQFMHSMCHNNNNWCNNISPMRLNKVSETFSSIPPRHFRVKKGENFSAEGWIASSSLLPEGGRDESEVCIIYLVTANNEEIYEKETRIFWESCEFICCAV